MVVSGHGAICLQLDSREQRKKKEYLNEEKKKEYFFATAIPVGTSFSFLGQGCNFFLKRLSAGA